MKPIPFRGLFLSACAALIATQSIGVSLAATSKAPAKPSYGYYLLGNAANVSPSTTAGTALMGGGTDVDDAFRWMVTKANGGDFVVVCATCTSYYNKYIKRLGTLDSVETLVVNSRTAANDPFVAQTIQRAEAIFITGGDQADYVNFWKGTAMEDAIHASLSRSIPIGGTSAGLAVLGEYSFAALNGTVTSGEALANPYTSLVSLERDFLHVPGMANIITDSHFVTRDRMGRLVAFLARIAADGWSNTVHGIGIDEQTAVLVEQNGTATLRGIGAAYFLGASGTPEVCLANTPLTYQNLSVFKMTSASSFNVSNWSGSNGTTYTVSANNGVLTSSQAGGSAY